MSKHTKGRWEAVRWCYEYDDNSPGSNFITVIQTKKDAICEVWNLYRNSQEEKYANANLIAAAPEMWELLKKIAEEDRKPLSTRLHFEVTELLSRLDSE